MFPPGMPGLAPNWVTLALNATDLGLFKISFSMTRRTRMYRNVIWTIEVFVSLGANLIHFEAKPDIHGIHNLLISLLSTTYTGISDLAHFWSDWHQVQQIVGPKV